MEILSAVALAASPFVVKWLTNQVKKLQSIQMSPQRRGILRAFVAFLAAIIATATAALSGDTITSDVVTPIVNAFFVFVSATGLYFWDKWDIAKATGRVIE